MTRKSRGQPKVLVIDDEPDLLELLELTLSRMGLDTIRAESVGEAIRLLDREPFDLCLTDMRLPDGEGLRVVEHINQKGLDVPVAVITARLGPAMVRKCRKAWQTARISIMVHTRMSPARVKAASTTASSPTREPV